MSSTAKKQWIVNPASGQQVRVEAARVQLDDARVRATFYDENDEVVASFTGFTNLYPVAE